MIKYCPVCGKIPLEIYASKFLQDLYTLRCECGEYIITIKKSRKGVYITNIEFKEEYDAKWIG